MWERLIILLHFLRPKMNTENESRIKKNVSTLRGGGAPQTHNIAM